MTARTATSVTIVHIGTRRPDRPTQVTDCRRAKSIAPKLTIAMAASHGTSQVGETSPSRFGTIISAATMFAAAKKGASWAREMSWTSRRGELSAPTSLAASPADSPPGSRAEIKRLYRSGASYIRPPLNCCRSE